MASILLSVAAVVIASLVLTYLITRPTVQTRRRAVAAAILLTLAASAMIVVTIDFLWRQLQP